MSARFRIKAVAVFLVLAFALSVAGCAGKQPEKVTIAAVAGAEAVPMKALIPEAEKALSIDIEWVELPYTTLYEKVLTDLQGKTGNYDLVFIDDPWMPLFAGGGYLTNLSKMGYEPDPDLMRKSVDLTLWPAPHGPRVPGPSMTATPEYYSVPLIADVELFFYRSDLMQKPETMDDWLAAIKAKSDPKNGFYGFVHRGARGNPIVSDFFPILYAFGGDIFDDNWNVIVNNQPGVDALNFYVGLLNYAPVGVANYDLDEIGAQLLQGQALTIISWSGWASSVDDPNSSKVVGKVDFSIPPKKVRSAAEIGNWLLGLPEGSKNKDAAYKVMEWLISQDTQRAFALGGGIPVRRSVLTDKDVVAKARWLPTVADALDNSVWRPRLPEWAQVEDTLGLYLNKALVKEMTPKAALDAAAEEITKILKKAGYYGSN